MNERPRLAVALLLAMPRRLRAHLVGLRAPPDSASNAAPEASDDDHPPAMSTDDEPWVTVDRHPRERLSSWG